VAVVFLHGGAANSIGRSRLYVHLARQLAGMGYHSLRVDLLGVGESTGPEPSWRLAELATHEPLAVVDWLRGQGLSKYVLAGSCWGARSALASAPAFDGLQGMVLFEPPVRDIEKGQVTASLPGSQFVRRAFTKRVLAGLRDPDRRKRYQRHVVVKARRLLHRSRRPDQARADRGFEARSFIGPLTVLVERGVPTLLFYGEQDRAYEEFTNPAAERLTELLERAGDLVEIILTPGKFHGLGQAEVQRITTEGLEAWLPGRGGVGSPTAESARQSS